jgi:hypothetical protein
MFSTAGKRLLLIAVVAVAGSASVASAAQAAVIDDDPVQLLSNKFDFGDNTFAAGAPTGSGNVAWDYSNGIVSPELTGTLHLRNAAGLCGRMRLEQFSRAGALLNTTVGGVVCAANNAHQVFAVNLAPAGNALTDHVLVSIERTGAAAGWTTAASVSVTANTHDDPVLIAPGGGAGFGGAGWLFGAPIGSGSVSWNLENGTLKPHLTGTLHLVNNAGTCARMNINYLTDAGGFITSRAGGIVCAPNNNAFAWSVNLAPYRDVLGQVEVELQTLSAAGAWTTLGSQTVSVAI